MEKEQTPLPFTAHEAWSHMRDVLDREMPEKKKRRRLAFWLLPFALAGLPAIWLLQPGAGKKATSGAAIETKQSAGKDLLTTNADPSLQNDAAKDLTTSPLSASQRPVINTNEQPVLAEADKEAYRRHPDRVSKKILKKKKANPAPALSRRSTVPAEIIIDANDDIIEEALIDSKVSTTTTRYPVAVPLHPPVASAKKLAPVTTRPGIQALDVKAPPPVQSTPKNTVLNYGIRTGAFINNMSWANSKRVLFPQRLATLEFYVEKPLGNGYFAELSVNLFSSRNIQYRLETLDSNTGPGGLYHRQYHQYAVQGLHFTDLQLLLHKQIHTNWRLHGGIYLSAFKNASVAVDKYDSTAQHTGGGTYFETARQKGYTYARKLDGVDLVSPFIKTDIGLMAGIAFRKKQLQAGLTAQVGLRPLYTPAAGAVGSGQRNTLQLKLWLGWQINR